MIIFLFDISQYIKMRHVREDMDLLLASGSWLLAFLNSQELIANSQLPLPDHIAYG